ncbi:MAG: ATP-binding protein, partial [Solirubrobacteraceae bacterium]
AVTRIHSAAGLHDGYGAMFDRPFRAPHHTTSPSGMLGTWTQPGEITLAHHGILYLDHAHQLHPDVLDELHAASRAGTMRVQQGHRARTMPAGALLIAAVPPCPCGQGESAYSCASRDHGAFEQHLHRLENRFDVTIRLPAYRHREA